MEETTHKVIFLYWPSSRIYVILFDKVTWVKVSHQQGHIGHLEGQICLRLKYMYTANLRVCFISPISAPPTYLFAIQALVEYHSY